MPRINIMKIVQLISCFTPGGAEVFVKNLSIELSKSEEVQVWALSKSNDLGFAKKMIEELQINNINTRILGKRPHKDRVKTILLLKSALRKYKPDVINSHLEHITFFASLSNMFSNRPIIQTIHSTKISRPKMQRLFLNKLLNCFVAVSNKTKTILINKVGIPQNKIEVIYNGIDCLCFLAQNRNTKKTSIKIIAIGRLHPAKNYEGLLKAFKLVLDKLREENPYRPILDIVGDGKPKNSLITLTDQLNLQDKVNFLGVRNDIPQLLADHDIYVMSSLWEGLSISLLEALASGIPIVATNVGSNDEIIDNGIDGLLAEPDNPEALAEKIIELIRNPDLRRRISMNAVQKSKQFSIEKTAKNYLKVYKKFINIKDLEIQEKTPKLIR